MITDKMLKEWCNKHNATLLWMGGTRFAYQTYNGMMWEMPYDEIEI